MKLNLSELRDKFETILDEFNDNNGKTIPFCAAEPIVSEAVRSPLSSALAERYIKSGINSFNPSKEFVGSEFIYPLYEMVSEICRELFGVNYADARPLSGMNAALTTLMSLTNPGDSVLLLHPDAGAHESFPKICERLSLQVDYLPFDYNSAVYHTEEINALLKKGCYRALIIPPSDLLAPPPIEEFSIPKETIVIYDATQSLGFIAGGFHSNPLLSSNNVVVLGGTHKSISGPTCGLVLCNSEKVSKVLEDRISPIFVRNPHPHHIASLVVALIEFYDSGSEFMSEILKNANYFAQELENVGFRLVKTPNQENQKFTETHQIFLSVTEQEVQRFESSARRLNISMDRKNKAIYGTAGIRLGVQAVTRLGWQNRDFSSFAIILAKIKAGTPMSELEHAVAPFRALRNSVKFSLDANGHGFPVG